MSTATLDPATSSIPRINDTAPDFTADTTQGPIRFHEWIGNGWAVLFSHPKDFTPVCTTELGAMAKLQPEFAKRNAKILAISVDPVSDHVKWQADIEETQGAKVMGLAVHPYISGVPHRTGWFEQALGYLAAKPGTLFWQGRQIMDWYLKATA